MKKNTNQAFTFVELIVVITIMAILSTIGFMVYKDYLASSYDSNRIKQLNDIHDGLELMSVSSKLPFPDNMLELTSSGTTFAYQGDAGDAVIRAIGYDGGGKDPEFGTPFVYMLSKGGKDFQLMGFIKDNSLLSVFPQEGYADSIVYADFFPIIKGNELGVLLEKSSMVPIHISNNFPKGKYDIVSGTGYLNAYLSNKNIIREKEKLVNILPSSNCKRILELGNSKGNGYYRISPDGGASFQVYCDMEVDGGGWTLVARSVKNSAYTGDFGWLYKTGNIKDDTIPYSLGPDVKKISFSEMMIGVYDFGKSIRKYNNSQDNLTFGMWSKDPNRTGYRPSHNPEYVAIKTIISNPKILSNELATATGGTFDTTKDNDDSPFVCFHKCGGGTWGRFNDNQKYYRAHGTSSSFDYIGITKDGFQGLDFDGYPGIIFIR